VYFPLVGNFLMGRDIVSASSSLYLKQGYTEWTSGIYVGPDFVNPYGDAHNFFVGLLNVISYISMLFDLVHIFVVITVYINLFKCYWPQHYILAAILSLIGLFAPFVFVIRKKDPVNYMDYVRSRYSNYYGPNGANGPYGPYGPYGQGPRGPYGYYGGGQTPPNRPEEPFNDYQDPKDKKPEEPFSDF
jgi:hypothetical protein